jgi:hypothetical protein
MIDLSASPLLHILALSALISVEAFHRRMSMIEDMINHSTRMITSSAKEASDDDIVCAMALEAVSRQNMAVVKRNFVFIKYYVKGMNVIAIQK